VIAIRLTRRTCQNVRINPNAETTAAAAAPLRPCGPGHQRPAGARERRLRAEPPPLARSARCGDMTDGGSQANNIAQHPANAGGAIEPRGAVNRVAGVVQRLVRHDSRYPSCFLTALPSNPGQVIHVDPIFRYRRPGIFSELPTAFANVKPL
jgi:hypothetical protein